MATSQGDRRKGVSGREEGGGGDGTNPEALWNSEFKAGRRNRLEEMEGGGHAAPRGGGRADNLQMTGSRLVCWRALLTTDSLLESTNEADGGCARGSPSRRSSSDVLRRSNIRRCVSCPVGELSRNKKTIHQVCFCAPPNNLCAETHTGTVTRVPVK